MSRKKDQLKNIGKIKVGSRISIMWPNINGYELWCHATITEKKNNVYTIKYDQKFVINDDDVEEEQLAIVYQRLYPVDDEKDELIWRLLEDEEEEGEEDEEEYDNVME